MSQYTGRFEIQENVGFTPSPTPFLVCDLNLVTEWLSASVSPNNGIIMPTFQG